MLPILLGSGWRCWRSCFGFQASPATPAAGDWLNKYCVSCHNQKLKTANLMLDRADSVQVANSAETWEKVIVKLRSRAMPPPGMPRPDNATYDSVADWLESEIDRAAAAHVNPGRTASLHRLNRAEYANAVRDLIAVDVDAQAMLPPDEQAFGFENNAEALSMPPALLDRYVSAAAAIARRAVGDPNMPPAFVRYGAMKNNANDQTYLRQTERLGEDFPLGTKGGDRRAPLFSGGRGIRVQASSAAGLGNLHPRPERAESIRNPRGWSARRAIYARRRESAVQAKNFLYDGDEALQVRVPVKAGLRQVMATMLKSDNAVPEGGGPDRLSPYSRSSDNASSPIAIASLLIGGPYDGKVPLDSPSRKLLFVCQPSECSDEIPPARPRSCRTWRAGLIGVARPMTTCRRCSASTNVRARPEPSTTGFAPRWSACW